MTSLPEILDEALQYVQTYLLEHLTPAFHYHNYAHAEEVLEVSMELSTDAGLAPEQTERIALAAAFHDCGYATDPADIATKSVEVATGFLKDKNYPEEGIKEVITPIYVRCPAVVLFLYQASSSAA